MLPLIAGICALGLLIYLIGAVADAQLEGATTRLTENYTKWSLLFTACNGRELPLDSKEAKELIRLDTEQVDLCREIKFWSFVLLGGIIKTNPRDIPGTLNAVAHVRFFLHKPDIQGKPTS